MPKKSYGIPNDLKFSSFLSKDRKKVGNKLVNDAQNKMQQTLNATFQAK